MKIKLYSVQRVWFVFPAIKGTFQAPKNTFEINILEVTFYYGKNNFKLKSYYYIALILKSKNNFTLSYPNKNNSLKLILTYSNQTQINSFKSNSSKSNSFNLILSKVKPNIP